MSKGIGLNRIVGKYTHPLMILACWISIDFYEAAALIVLNNYNGSDANVIDDFDVFGADILGISTENILAIQDGDVEPEIDGGNVDFGQTETCDEIYFEPFNALESFDCINIYGNESEIVEAEEVDPYAFVDDNVGMVEMSRRNPDTGAFEVSVEMLSTKTNKFETIMVVTEGYARNLGCHNRYYCLQRKTKKCHSRETPTRTVWII